MARAACWIAMVAACQQPDPPKKQADAPVAAKQVAPPPAQPQLPAQPPPIAPPPAAQEATADFVTHDCLDASAHVIELTIAGIADPKERVIQDRKRATMVRQTAEECSKHPWTPDVIRCFAAADSLAKMRECDRRIQ